MNFSEHKDFEATSANLKLVRTFAREVFQKSERLNGQQEELVLAIAEAAQNIVKHAYKDVVNPDKMRVKISFDENELVIDLLDRGKPVVPANIKPRKLDDIKPGGLGTFFIGQIMDEVLFKTSKSEDWVNHLILKKTI